MHGFQDYLVSVTKHRQWRHSIPGNSCWLYRQLIVAGLPGSGKNIWKMKFFPGPGKVREFRGWPWKFRKDWESWGKVREFENEWLWQSSENIFNRGKRMYFLMR